MAKKRKIKKSTEELASELFHIVWCALERFKFSDLTAEDYLNTKERAEEDLKEFIDKGFQK